MRRILRLLKDFHGELWLWGNEEKFSSYANPTTASIAVSSKFLADKWPQYTPSPEIKLSDCAKTRRIARVDAMRDPPAPARSSPQPQGLLAAEHTDHDDHAP